MREKLIELIGRTPCCGFSSRTAVEHIVDQIISKGVTIRKEGRWKGAGMGEYRCSLCDEIVSGDHHNYCPSCGAYMK